jgi:mannose/cellobiose epimerase-like protein (N-acyl-D-glucosamine 2-epimerase family)
MITAIELLNPKPGCVWRSHRVGFPITRKRLSRFLSGEIVDGGRSTLPGYGAARKRRDLFTTSRIFRVYTGAYRRGRPRADIIVDHGTNFLWTVTVTPTTEGTIGMLAVMDHRAQPQAYDDAFLFAASTTKVVGHPEAELIAG